MATTEIVLRVFVAAPSDVASEVDVVSDCIDELNRTLPRRSGGIRLELVTWRNTAFPGIGDDPQDVINQQVGDCDIFVGLLWGRFGTPTKRAGSGTEEEFHRAHSRFVSDPKTVRVMMYFKNAPIEYDQIDPLQFSGVRSFRRELETANGVLYFEFPDAKVLASLLRVHLVRQVSDYGKSWGQSNIASFEIIRPVETAKAAQRLESEPEEGLIDLNERGTQSFGFALQSIARVHVLLDDIGAKASQRTLEVQSLGQVAESQRNALTKHIFGLAATDLCEFARGLHSEVPTLSRHLEAGFECISKVLQYKEFFESSDGSDLRPLVAPVAQMADGIEKSRVMAVELQQTIVGLPRVTTEFNRSKREASVALDAFERVLKVAGTSLTEILKQAS